MFLFYFRNVYGVWEVYKNGMWYGLSALFKNCTSCCI